MNILYAIISIFIAQSAGIVGSLFTASAIDTWYVDLVQPSFAPPNWVFGPVWVTLYTLMGIAAYLVFKQRNKRKAKIALVAYAIQLVLNSLWSILFFGQQLIGVAFIEIIFLLLAIVVTTVYFFKINKVAGWLMVPYLLWVSFASILNASFWILN